MGTKFLQSENLPLKLSGYSSARRSYFKCSWNIESLLPEENGKNVIRAQPCVRAHRLDIAFYQLYLFVCQWSTFFPRFTRVQKNVIYFARYDPFFMVSRTWRTLHSGAKACINKLFSSTHGKYNVLRHSCPGRNFV